MSPGERALVGFLVSLTLIGYAFLVGYLISCLRHFIPWSDD